MKSISLRSLLVVALTALGGALANCDSAGSGPAPVRTDVGDDSRSDTGLFGRPGPDGGTRIGSNTRMVVFFEGFEGDDAMEGWTARDRRAARGRDTWGPTSRRTSTDDTAVWSAQSGRHSVQKRPNREVGRYDYGAVSELLYAETLNARKMSEPRLKFDVWYALRDGANLDSLELIASRDGGKTWRPLPFERKQGSNGGWTTETVEIPPRFQVKNFTFGFRFTAGAPRARPGARSAEGVYLDQIRVTARCGGFHVGHTAARGPCEIHTQPSPSRIWFTANVGYLGKLNPQSGQVIRYDVPNPRSIPTGLAEDSHGDLWVTEWGSDGLLRFDIEQESFERFEIPTDAAQPFSAAEGPNGHIWFTEWNAGKVGRLDPSTGDFREWEVPTDWGGEPPQPRSIAQGPDGAMWFTQPGDNQIAKIDAETGEFTEFRMPTVTNARPTTLKIGPDDEYVYFTAVARSAVGRMRLRSAPDGFTLLPVPPPSRPSRLAFRSSGTLWLTQIAGSQISSANFDSRSVDEIDLPERGSAPEGIGIDAEDRVWFTEYTRDRLGRYDPDSDQIDEFDLDDEYPPLRVDAAVAREGERTIRVETTVEGGVAPYDVEWSFGDGETASGRTASHAYDAPGSYTVEATVSDAFPQSKTAAQTVDIE